MGNLLPVYCLIPEKLQPREERIQIARIIRL